LFPSTLTLIVLKVLTPPTVVGVEEGIISPSAEGGLEIVTEEAG
jgi:hypothetical protein